ncbi:MAG: polysaccharide export protein, partial [Alphaproteobacteria bacterium]|nr:polysaccharide export protein [Alphaproteobacteria bacterium]
RAFPLLLLIAGLGAGSAQADDGLRGDGLETVVVHAPAYADYRLGPGDKLRVTVYDETDLSGEFQVDDTGYVRLPLIGAVKAGGETAHQLEGAVGTALADGFLKEPRVNIEVTAYRPFYIIGQVNRPGQYPYNSNMSALDAIGIAGGFTEHAVESTVHIRHEGESKEIDVAADASVKIRPGDVIRVDQTLFWDIAGVLSPTASAASLAYVLRP